MSVLRALPQWSAARFIEKAYASFPVAPTRVRRCCPFAGADNQKGAKGGQKGLTK